MRLTTLLVLLLIAVPVVADETKTRLGQPYAEPQHERQMLDVYAPAKGQGLPIVVWIHGGAWRPGDKASVQHKPQAFVDKGYVFVSTNYRFVPQVTVKEMAGDIAKAIRWVHDHAQEYGGNPKSIFVMGHSAGAHLAALVCTDDRYLKAEGLSLSIIAGCVPVDSAVYDIPKQMANAGPVRMANYNDVFGTSEANQKEFSPITHVGKVNVAKDKRLPPFLILHVADRLDAKVQSQTFADRLKAAGVSAQVVAAEGATHASINRNLGMAEDAPTRQVWEFLQTALSQPDRTPAEPALSKLAPPELTPTAQIEKLKKLGARITLDDQGRVVDVHLGERRVTDADLALLRGLQQLQELDLTRTQITGAGLEHLQDLAALRKLYLTDTKVDDAGIAHLKRLKNLRLVGLSGTKITDAALDHFRDLAELKQLFCLGTAVTDTGAEKLRQSLPECQVTN